MKNATLIGIIDRMIEDFNTYSELVALNYAKKKENSCPDNVLEWNRGHLYCVEEYLRELAEDVGVKLEWECGIHKFGYDDWQRWLEYVTVRRVKEW